MRTVRTTRPSYDSPLRYPGGKSSLTGFLSEAIKSLAMRDTTYVEPFAGGAGAAVSLLLREDVSRIVINDLDPAVHAFWWSILHDTSRFLDRLAYAPLNLDEWRKQREVYAAGLGSAQGPIDLGFAFFYLNRTNRSGVLNAGVIGGQAQAGRYKMDARFNREALALRVQALAERRDQITVTSEDGRAVVEKYATKPDVFIYVDPPYVQMGGSLYLNSFTEADHTLLSVCLNRNANAKWILTYDDVPLIRELYADRFLTTYELNYSARNRGKAEELMVLSDPLNSALSSG